jgi:hypothetical protein
MDINRFIPSNDKSLLYRLENEGQPIAVGSYEDFLKLELPDSYKKRLETEKSSHKVEDGSGTTNNSERKFPYSIRLEKCNHS